MDSQLKGNFIMISPHEKIAEPIAIFNIVGIGEEYTTEYYPIMSNFYDTALWRDTSITLMDISNSSVPPQALQYYMVNKIVYNNTVYWLSDINDNSFTYRSIKDPTTVYLKVVGKDNWATYTITPYSGGAIS